MRRRDILKGVGLGLSTAVFRSVADAREPPGPFSLPTARFSAKKAEQPPAWAFRSEVPYPLVPRPTFIGTYAEVMKSDRAFGPTDPVKVGECFHGIAREWAETPVHWSAYGCTPAHQGPNKSWEDKQIHFGKVKCFDSERMINNWGEFKIKCYKIPIVESLHDFRTGNPIPARVYTYGGTLPGPTLKMRLGQPVVVRYENHLEAEMSIHLHGGHSPSHSDGFPSFYVLQGKARDYFYPNMLPLYRESDGTYRPDTGESQSTMWYHDHAMDATAYNVSKGVAGFAPCFGEEELALIATRVLPGYGPESCKDPEIDGFKLNAAGQPDPNLESEKQPGFYKHELGCEPYFNPFDIPLVLQDRVFDEATGQIAYDNTGHNGYLGDTMVVNGVAYPKLSVRNRKYRFRILDGSNARIFSLRILSEADYYRLRQDGTDDATEIEANALEVTKARHARYEQVAKPFLRIGKDSWLWSRAVEKRRIVLAMANRADIIVDFAALTAGDLTHEPLKPGETRAFYLVNTMPQTDGRGPKLKLDDGGDPRVLPLPFDTVDQPVKEAPRPVALMKFEVRYEPPGSENDPAGDREASVQNGTKLICNHRRIEDEEIKVVREFIFERGKGAWQVNGRFYDPTIANACPTMDHAEEWILKNEGGGWWHPIHIHLESHQLIAYEKDEAADLAIDPADPPTPNRLVNLRDVTHEIHPVEVSGMHDTQVLGPNTKVRIRIRTRTWEGPFVFHCHNLEHEDMRMMFNFEPVPSLPGHTHDPNVAPASRTHGNDVTWKGYTGELPWEYATVPPESSRTVSEYVIAPRKRPGTHKPTPQ